MSIMYNSIFVGDNNYKISPSSLTNFYRNPKEWLQNFEGHVTFEGNAATILGTCIHYVFECNFNKTTDEQYWKDVQEYCQEQASKNVISEAEYTDIIATTTTMYPQIIEWIQDTDTVDIMYSEPAVKYKLPTSITGKVDNDYYVAGSIDAIIFDETANSKHQFGIRDYKTSKRKVSSISNYIHQLVTYAVSWNATHSDDEQVGFVEVVNIYNTKTKGVQFNVIRKYLTPELVTGLENILKEIVLSHKAIIKYPQLRPFMFRDGVDFMGKLSPLGEK